MKKKMVGIAKLVRAKYVAHFSRLTINTSMASVVISFRAKIQNSGKILVNGKLNVLDYVRIVNKNGEIVLGNNVLIRNNAKIRTLNGTIRIGDNTTVNDYTFIIGNEAGVEIGGSVRIAPFVKIFAENHVFDNSGVDIHMQGMQSKGIKIGDNVWIGTGAIIVDGVNIGDNVVIGAGSVVVNNIESNSLVVGNPGRVIRGI